jgi:hypothetical protein
MSGREYVNILTNVNNNNNNNNNNNLWMAQVELLRIVHGTALALSDDDALTLIKTLFSS